MTRWPAIAALGVMAWPVAFLIGIGFVGSVESWKWGFWNDPCAWGHPPPVVQGQKHCLAPVTAVTPLAALQMVGIVALLGGLWWGVWYYEMRATRGVTGSPSAVPAGSVFLALWFFGATAFCTVWAAQHHTFM